MYLVVSALLISIALWVWKKNSRLPPGPIGLPIIGYLHKLGGKSLHFIMYDLSRIYGDVFSIKLGSRLAVVLSSHEAIYEAYVKQAKHFAGRPDLASFVKTNHESVGISLTTFQDTYEYNRKNTMRAVHRLYTSVESFDKLLHRECRKMMEMFDESINKNEPIQPLIAFKKIVPSAFLAMMFGTDFQYENTEFLEISEWYNKWFESAEADNPPDFFPFLQNLPNERLDLISECGMEFEKFTTRKLFEFENVEEDIGLVYSLFDTFGKISNLSPQKKRNLARVVADLCGGGFDTVASSLAWAPIYLLEQPEVLTKCREEIRSVYGDNPISFEKKDMTPYFSAALYDILRHSSVGPLALPRVTMKDVKYRSYLIPKNTMVFVNLWACNHNQEVWKKTEFLHPENFLSDNGELDREAVRKLYTFSYGVRRCPGEKLAFQKMFILLGTLIQKYDFEICEKPEDMLPMRGVTLKPKHYSITMKPFSR